MFLVCLLLWPADFSMNLQWLASIEDIFMLIAFGELFVEGIAQEIAQTEASTGLEASTNIKKTEINRNNFIYSQTIAVVLRSNK